MKVVNICAGEKCPICVNLLLIYGAKGGLLQAPCKHIFHGMCLTEWMISGIPGGCCPLCKKRMTIRDATPVMPEENGNEDGAQGIQPVHVEVPGPSRMMSSIARHARTGETPPSMAEEIRSEGPLELQGQASTSIQSSRRTSGQRNIRTSPSEENSFSDKSSSLHVRRFSLKRPRGALRKMKKKRSTGGLCAAPRIPRISEKAHEILRRIQQRRQMEPEDELPQPMPASARGLPATPQTSTTALPVSEPPRTPISAPPRFEYSGSQGNHSDSPPFSEIPINQELLNDSNSAQRTFLNTFMQRRLEKISADMHWYLQRMQELLHERSDIEFFMSVSQQA